MSTLFVSSFSPDLYEASGRRLVDSFLKVQLRLPQGDRMLLCTEGLGDGPCGEGSLLYRNLDKDEWLHEWLREWAHLIPDYLGGTATECDCPDRAARHGKHKARCHWQWMNRNASRWFRKVAALRLALGHLDGHRFLVWLDSDAYFQMPLPEAFSAGELESADMYYFRGHRPGVESGVLGFKAGGGAKAVVKALCRRYTTGAFTEDERWDDGFQIGRLIDTNADHNLRFRDLVHPYRHKGRTNDVIPTTGIHPYVRHVKGTHGTKLNIMK